MTDGLGPFMIAIGASLILRPLLDTAVPFSHQLAVMTGLLAGIVVGEWLRLSDRLDALGAWAADAIG